MITPDNVMDWNYVRAASGRYILDYIKVREEVTSDGSYYRMWTPNDISYVFVPERGKPKTLEVKPNQIGTISETFEALTLTRKLGLVDIISARSGETEDVTIADLSIGWQTNQIKVGSFSRTERLAKWNQCLRIGEQLKNNFKMQKNYVLGWNKF